MEVEYIFVGDIWLTHFFTDLKELSSSTAKNTRLIGWDVFIDQNFLFSDAAINLLIFKVPQDSLLFSQQQINVTTSLESASTCGDWFSEVLLYSHHYF